MGWKAFSHFRAASVAQAQQHWHCPMRCLNNKLYDGPGKCPVCHMDLVLLPEGRSRGAAQAIHVNPWPELDGKTAIYFRPYTVQKIQADNIVRVAGKLSQKGRLLTAKLDPGQRAVVKKGATAMLAPASGYARPVYSLVEGLSGGIVRVRASHPLEGFDYALAEIRVSASPSLAVPEEALSQDGSKTYVFLQTPQGYVPKTVKVKARGESFIEVEGLQAGDQVAASGIFWLEAQWRMDHPNSEMPN
jgi:hypothetical protein